MHHEACMVGVTMQDHAWEPDLFTSIVCLTLLGI